MGMLLLGGAVFGPVAEGRAPGFEARGSMVWEAPERERAKVTSWRFVVRVSLPSWQIIIEPDDPEEAKHFIDSSREIGCDGTAVYELGVFNSQYDNRGQIEAALRRYREIERRILEEIPNSPDLPKLQRNIWTLEQNLTNEPPADVPKPAARGVVRAGVMPPMGTHPVLGLLWLAFCGNQLWAGLPPGVMPALPPVTGMSVSASPDQAFYVAAQWSSAQDPFGLLHSIHIPAETQVFQGALLGTTTPIRLRKVHGHPEIPYGQGYRIESFVSCEGWRIPGRILWWRDGKPEVSDDRYRGEVKEAKPLPPGWTYRPRLPVLTSVADYRHWNHVGRHVGFLAEPGPWPGTEEVQLTAEFKRVEASARNVRAIQGNQAIKWLMRALVLVVLLAGPVVTLWRGRVRRRPEV